MFCREQVARLGERYDEIRDKGAELYAIGNGSAHFAKAFVEDYDVDFPVFTDPRRESFKAFEMKKGSGLSLLSPKVLAHGARAMSAGHRQGRTKGSALQNGGVVVMKGGAPTYVHIEDEAGDLADLDEVIAAL